MFAEGLSGAVASGLGVGQGGLSNKAQPVQEGSRCKGIRGGTSKEEIKCVCLNARSIINKKNRLNIMVDYIKPHIFFNKIAIQGAPQIAVDKEATSLSRVYSYYSKCNLPLFYV